MASEEEKPAEGKGFTVQDRRRFSPETGAPRDNAPEEATGPAQPAAAAASNAERDALPEINFSAFVISLSTQALMHLGEIADPVSGQAETDLAGAKQMIDILSLLQQKTRGNLDAGEQQLVEDILYDLRMRYVDAVKKR